LALLFRGRGGPIQGLGGGVSRTSVAAWPVSKIAGEKKPARRPVFENNPKITWPERLQPAWQRQQPEQQRQQAWQRQRPEQQRQPAWRRQQQERRQPALRQQREQQQELQQQVPEQQPVLPSCRKQPGR